VINSKQRPLPDNKQHSQETDIYAPAGFEPTIPASERQQTHALGRADTWIGRFHLEEGTRQENRRRLESNPIYELFTALLITTIYMPKLSPTGQLIIQFRGIWWGVHIT
jgi:hypothetical protein